MPSPFREVFLLALIALAVLSWLRWRQVRESRRNERAYQQQLREREERLTLALWGSGDEFWDWDIAHDQLFRVSGDVTNPAQPNLDSPAAPWRDREIHSDDLPAVEAAIKRHIDGIDAFYESEHRVRKNDGSWGWVRARGRVVARNTDGMPTRIAGTVRDITRDQDAKYEQQIAHEVLRSMSEAVAVIDTEFRFVSVNHAFTRITGFEPHEVVGQQSFLLNSPQHSQSFYASVRDTLQRDGHWSGEMWQRRKDGEEFLALLSISEVSVHGRARSHFVAVVSDITQRKRIEQELHYLANYDSLTGLASRSLLSEQLAHAIVRARRQNTKVAVLFLDLDRFKDINDSLGHTVGDRILKAVASRLQANVRSQDLVARLSGDEFTIVLEDLLDTHAAEAAARKIIEALKAPLSIDEQHDVVISPSIGISIYPDHGLVPTDLLKFADTAMYQAKAGGRNTFQIYTESMEVQTRRRAQMAAALHKAFDRGELRLLFQPKLALASGDITGVEALLRWHSNELGTVPPNEFIPIAEEIGLIVPIGEWALREALITLKRWRHAGFDHIRMAINVSVLQLLRANLPELLANLIAEIDIPADRIELEITESMVMAKAEEANNALNALRQTGISIAIDDFGTGYSSLVYLKRLPIDTLKIDKEFIGDLLHDPDDASITATVIGMAHSLGLYVIAEGVETEHQLDFLRQHGCDEIQGYWLSPPMDGHHCLAFIRAWHPTRDSRLDSIASR